MNFAAISANRYILFVLVAEISAGRKFLLVYFVIVSVEFCMNIEFLGIVTGKISIENRLVLNFFQTIFPTIQQFQKESYIYYCQ
jgi:hypothetical protein